MLRYLKDFIGNGVICDDCLDQIIDKVKTSDSDIQDVIDCHLGTCQYYTFKYGNITKIDIINGSLLYLQHNHYWNITMVTNNTSGNFLKGLIVFIIVILGICMILGKND